MCSNPAVRSEELVLELDAIVTAVTPLFGDATRDEVAVACRVSGAEAQRRLDAARALVLPGDAGPGDERLPRLPLTAAALAAGEISLEHAEKVVGATHGLDEAAARWVEQVVLDDPRARTPGQLEHRARQAALQVGADRAERRAAAAADRTLTAWERAGRVDLSWSMPSADAAVVRAWLDRVAVEEGADDVRLPAQRRADALFEAVRRSFVDGAGDADGRRTLPRLDVIVTHESLLDRIWRDAGFARQLAAPITARLAGTLGTQAAIDGRSVFGEQVRRLGCDADLRTTLIDERGCILDQGRTTRVVSARLRGLLEVRDQHCRFPGCTAAARSCHAHHIWHWADGGPTDLRNLLLVCERHHHAVHDGGWQIDAFGDGTVVWTSPGGQHVSTAAELDTLPPLPPRTDSGFFVDELARDADWIRPVHELRREPPPSGAGPPQLAGAASPTSRPSDRAPARVAAPPRRVSTAAVGGRVWLGSRPWTR